MRESKPQNLKGMELVWVVLGQVTHFKGLKWTLAFTRDWLHYKENLFKCLTLFLSKGMGRGDRSVNKTYNVLQRKDKRVPNYLFGKVIGSPDH